MRSWFRLGVLAAAAASAGCGGRGALVPAAGGGAPAARAVGSPVAIVRVVVPSSAHSFVVASTRGAKVTVYRHGRRAHPVAARSANLAKGSSACKPSKSGRACEIALALPASGKYDFAIETFDKSPKHGKIPPTAKELAAGVTAVSVSKTKTIPAVLGGVVASTQISLPVAAGPAIDPLVETAVVEAHDADGNLIVADAYEGANGKPVTIAISADSAAGTTISFSPAAIAKPVAGVQLAYSPVKMTSVQATSGFATAIGAAASNGAPDAGATLTLSAPQVDASHVIPTSAGFPIDIAAGPDGAMWFAERSANQIGTVTTAWSFHEYPTTSAGDSPRGIVAGPDGNLWFASQSNDSIDKMPASGAPVTPFGIPTAASAPDAVALGADGALWFTEYSGNKIGRITTAGGTPSEYSIPTTASRPVGIAAGPDGALWFTEEGGGKIGRVTTAGSFSEYPVSSGQVPQQIAAGPDGAMWFTTCGEYVGRIATDGSMKLYDFPNSNPNGIASGPDGAMWFGMVNAGGSDSIGRLSPDGTVFTQYTLPGSNPYPASVAKGPDGAVWFTEINTGVVGRIQ
jgi:virginiamycin B lyase